MKQLTFLNFLITLILLSTGCNSSEKQGKKAGTVKFEGIEFNMPDIHLPAIPENEVSITDFGAVSGGIELNTQAFADAIEAVSKRGGGKVIIPAGIWLTGPVILKSNLELHAQSGALIVFSDNKDLYPVIETSFEGLNTWRCMSPVYGKNIENVAFTGPGVWDGSGDAWRFVKKSKVTESQWKKLVSSGGVLNKQGTEWYPSEQFKQGIMGSGDQNVRYDLKTKEDFEAIRDYLRPVMVSIQNSKHVLFDGPTFQNSPAWCIHPLMVEGLVVRNLTVRNPWYSQNGDGIDIESCKNVLVENCNFDVGDDAICIKSGKDKSGRLRGKPCENLVIRNNIVFHGHGGVTVGSEMSGGVKNMHVSECTFIGTDVGLRFKSNRGRGGIVENIYVSGIRMKDIPTYAISFNLYYGGRSISEMLETGKPDSTQELIPVSEETPQFKNIVISGISVNGAMQAVQLQGLPEMNLENVELKNMVLMADNGISVADAKGIKIQNIQLVTVNKKAIDIYNAQNLEIDRLDFDFSSANSISVQGEKSKNIVIQNQQNTNIPNYVFIGDEVKKEELIFK